MSEALCVDCALDAAGETHMHCNVRPYGLLLMILCYLGCSHHDTPQPSAGTGGKLVMPVAGAAGAVGMPPNAGSTAMPVAGRMPAAVGGSGATAPSAVAGSAGTPITSSNAGMRGAAGVIATAGLSGSAGAAGVGAAAGIGAAGAAGISGAGSARTCTGKAGAKRGKSTESVMAGGQKRSFVYYAPQTLKANAPVPLVIVPHGYTQSGAEMFAITKYPELADREGFVVMFPDGAPGSVGPWDVGSGVCGNGSFVPGSGDDQELIDRMIAFADADQCIDHDHIFMTGWSMGGYLSNHSGCLRDDLRAIGPHSGGTHDLRACKGKKKPVILFHFDPDGLIDYDCGVKARDAWIERNGCQATAPEVKQVKGGKCEYYKGCREAQVAFCTFQIPDNHLADFLAGHAWSGGTVHAYSIAETESAAELGWSFFKTYAW